MGRMTSRRRVFRVVDGNLTMRPDTLSAEEPLEIRVAGRALTITMRTPGSDFDLAAGFLVGEGIVSQGADVAGIRYCAWATVDGSNTYNIVDVLLRDGVPLPDPSIERTFYTTSSCGLCGKASLDAVRTTVPWPVEDDPLSASPGLLAGLPDALRAAQQVFDRTGGLHAAGLFDGTGRLLCVREDVGRHNAVDKVAGWAAREGRLPLAGTVLMVSGRASFELVQKAAMAGIPLLAAVSAPSSLAVELAEELGLTLVGFLRGSSMNVYTRADRLGLHDPRQLVGH
ncbi:formate dehydrogenase accessory sulfurtransferase FdhD [Amycolatopsis sp. FDAARGOS 1241]|uniref:formate dehydrogenase accessory sulfurtransferase FdhD n=1 Tax=Amycolatopsis sp. FDAARGOS 1241 TaxID=2778070 RepID=UPI001950F79E|nr:formate dehydrogenase accessory sulfurtransferase FdhD [Amycolatopsis sp. FDAARGOS 1241]QRP49848.1 formate dehydrogenase accessory sulfurtransferase FdhD [Amycolatopsis sp. FDAARGOS 1241]